MSDKPPLPRRKKVFIVSLSIVVVLIAIYAVAGFFVLPAVVQSKLPAIVKEQLNLSAGVRDIAINPFAFSVRVEGFQATFADGSELVAVDELYVNFSAVSIFGRTYHFEEVTLTAPGVLLVLNPDLTLNIDPILSSFGGAEAPDSQPAELPPVSVGQVNLRQGRVKFENRSRPETRETILSAIEVTIRGLSTLKDASASYEVAAVLQEDNTLRLAGTASIQPLGTRAKLEARSTNLRTLWKTVENEVNFEIPAGAADLAAQVEIALDGGDSVTIRIDDGSAGLKGFSVTEKGNPAPVATLPLLQVKGVHADYGTRKVEVESVEAADSTVNVWLAEDGTFSYEKLLETKFAGDRTAEKAGAAAGEKFGGWTVTVKNVLFGNAGFEFEDRTIQEPFHTVFSPIDLNVQQLSTVKNAKTSFQLNLQGLEGSRIGLKGAASIDPLSAEVALKIEDIPLKVFQAYLAATGRAQLVQGHIGIDGQVNYRTFGEQGPEIRFEGSTALANLEVVDPAVEGDFIKLDAVTVNGIRLDLSPNRLDIKEIVTTAPFNRVILQPDGSLNLNEAFSLPASAEGDALERSLPGRIVDIIKFNIQGPVPLIVQSARLENGTVLFSDRSIEPNFNLSVSRINSLVTNVSSEGSTPADVQLDARIADQAPLQVSGQISPFGKQVYSNVTMSLNNFDVTEVSSYSGKYAGYTIQQGKLSITMDYKLAANKVDGSNKILIKRLTFGQRTDSPDATSLPIPLAVALMKGLDGNITLNVPVSGDLDDPKFRVDNVIASALIDVVTAVVSSPFSILGGIASAVQPDELATVEFVPASAGLDPKQREKLDLLAKALGERPSLGLRIQGIADRKRDGGALARIELEKRVDKIRKLNSAQGSFQGQKPLDAAARKKVLMAIYEDVAGEKPQPAEGPDQQAVEALEEDLLAKLVNDSELARLARSRSQAIAEYLIEKGGVRGDRIYTIKEKIDDTGGSGPVKVLLAVTAR